MPARWVREVPCVSREGGQHAHKPRVPAALAPASPSLAPLRAGGFAPLRPPESLLLGRTRPAVPCRPDTPPAVRCRSAPMQLGRLSGTRLHTSPPTSAALISVPSAAPNSSQLGDFWCNSVLFGESAARLVREE